MQHMLFSCPFARSCWFSGPVVIRSDALQGTVPQILCTLATTLDEDEWTTCANMMWAIWRCRNDKSYSALTPTLQRFSTHLRAIRAETMLANAGKPRLSHNPTPRTQPQDDQPQDDPELICFVDGSWSQPWQGGCGFQILARDNLVAYAYKSVPACCPIQSEAMALQVALQFVLQEGYPSCTFYTDNITLAQACSALQPPTNLDWRAFAEAFVVWKGLKGNHNMKIEHVPREQNGTADALANRARIWGNSFTGFTYPIFPDFT